MRQQSAAPTTKVTVGAATGALSALIVWILNMYVLPPDRQIPAEIGMLLTTLLTFIASYVVPPSPGDAPTQ